MKYISTLDNDLAYHYGNETTVNAFKTSGEHKTMVNLMRRKKPTLSPLCYFLLDLTAFPSIRRTKTKALTSCQ